MRRRVGALVVLVVMVGVTAAPALAESGGDAATLRAAAGRLLRAELSGDGAGVCAVLDAPLTKAVRGRTCAQRWDARSGALGVAERRGLRRDLRALARAAVTIDGEHGSIALPAPLLDGHSRFYWTANCWMLTR